MCRTIEKNATNVLLKYYVMVAVTVAHVMICNSVSTDRSSSENRGLNETELIQECVEEVEK